MTDIVIHTWKCDGCQEISFRPAIELAHSADHSYYGRNNIHLCKKCESQGLIICSLCGTVHLKYVPCYGPYSPDQFKRISP